MEILIHASIVPRSYCGMVLPLQFTFGNIVNLAEFVSDIRRQNIEVVLNSHKFFLSKVNLLFFIICTFATPNLNCSSNKGRHMYEEEKRSF